MLVGAAVFGIGFGAAQNLTLLAAFARAGEAGTTAASAMWNAAFDAGTAAGALLLGIVAAGLGLDVTYVVVAVLLAARCRWPRPPPGGRPLLISCGDPVGDRLLRPDQQDLLGRPPQPDRAARRGSCAFASRSRPSRSWRVLAWARCAGGRLRASARATAVRPAPEEDEVAHLGQPGEQRVDAASCRRRPAGSAARSARRRPSAAGSGEVTAPLCPGRTDRGTAGRRSGVPAPEHQPGATSRTAAISPAKTAKPVHGASRSGLKEHRRGDPRPGVARHQLGDPLAPGAGQQEDHVADDEDQRRARSRAPPRCAAPAPRRRRRTGRAPAR